MSLLAYQFTKVGQNGSLGLNKLKTSSYYWANGKTSYKQVNYTVNKLEHANTQTDDA